MTEATWGSAIAFDLFLAGLSGGSFLLAALASDQDEIGWEACGRTSSLLAPAALAAGMAMLLLDLGQKHRFWQLLVRFNPVSPMSIGTWLLAAFAVICVVFALFWLPEDWRRRIPVVGKWPFWSDRTWRGRFGIIGVPFAVAVTIYTAVLLSVTSIPLWRNYLLPPVFFFSALATGFSGGVLLSVLWPAKIRTKDLSRPLEFIRKVFRIILPSLLLTLVFFMALVPGKVEEKNVFGALVGGWTGALWGGGIGLGIVLPLILCLSRKRWSILRAVTIFATVLIGGLILRWVLVVAGQM